MGTSLEPERKRQDEEEAVEEEHLNQRPELVVKLLQQRRLEALKENSIHSGELEPQLRADGIGTMHSTEIVSDLGIISVLDKRKYRNAFPALITFLIA